MSLNIIGNEDDLGNKAKNIIIMHRSGFCIPDTTIIDAENLQDFHHEQLNSKKRYIIRPSFDVEDQEEKSYAGFFRSIYPVDAYGINDMIGGGNEKADIFRGDGHLLKSFIIQEFIETDIYGVYFTRDPINILEKGYYELSRQNDGVTSGKEKGEIKLPFHADFRLKKIGSILEGMFGHPQDIEFCIHKGDIILFQTRNVTTGNETVYDFRELRKFRGIYKDIDNGEFDAESNVLISSILGKFLDIFIMGKRIYSKSGIRFNIDKSIPLLNHFISEYRGYLISKWASDLVSKLIFFGRLDTEALGKFYSDYRYSFDVYRSSTIKTTFHQKTNLKTRLILKQEQKKAKAFEELEKVKVQIKKISKRINGDINYLKIEEILDDRLDHESMIIKRKKIRLDIDLGNKISISDGLLWRRTNLQKKDYDWIYRGDLEGYIRSLDKIEKASKEKQILLIDDLNVDLNGIMDHISGAVVKEGSLLSHNTILLREYKIPSIMNYPKFHDLKEGDYLIL